MVHKLTDSGWRRRRLATRGPAPGCIALAPTRGSRPQQISRGRGGDRLVAKHEERER
jgi:hypothetical protein